MRPRRSSLVLFGAVGLSLCFVGCESTRSLRTVDAATMSPVLTPQEAELFGEPKVMREIAEGPHKDTSDYLYDPSDKSCDGYPRLQVETAPGTCLGLVLPKERAVDSLAKSGFEMPRTLVQVPGSSDFLVVDMGSWHLGKGKLFRMTKNSKGQYELKLLKSGLNLPHSVKVGPDGKFWINEMKRISRFSLSNGAIAGWDVVVDGLPATIDDSHPLSQFAFDPRNNDLYVNSGSPSDHCSVTRAGELQYCTEVEDLKKSAILKITAAQLNGPLPVKTWSRIAVGLRNSMALVIHPSGTLIQGENARDFQSLEEPFEEMNVIDLNRFTAGQESDQAFHYGWPYCYDFHATSPEWTGTKPIDCANLNAVNGHQYQKPYVLIPPHAAPLAAEYYHGDMFKSALEGKLLMSWHGYNPTGHRLVAFNVDANGRPVIGSNKALAAYRYDRGLGCQRTRVLKPDGGLDQYASYVELTTKWYEKPGARPRGNPAGFTVASDGSIWIAEDKNQTIVRLARDANAFVAEECDKDWDERVPFMAWRRAVKDSPQLSKDYVEMKTKLLTKYCGTCHDGTSEKSLADDEYGTLDFMTKMQWFRAQKPEKSRGLKAIMHVGDTPAMPLAGSPQFFGTAEGDEIIKLVKRWVGELPTDVDQRYVKSIVKTARKIRSKPTSAGAPCGQLSEGSALYIDPRKASFVEAEGWRWARAYLTPDNPALASKTCAWPNDGVFYVATQKL